MLRKPIQTKLKHYAKNQLSPKRFRHVLRVTHTGNLIARNLGLRKFPVTLACLGHDLAREWETSAYVPFVAARGYVPRTEELEKPLLLHGRVARYLLQEKFGIKDEGVLEAVEHHTLGKAGLGDIGKVLYVADYIEPGRKYVSGSFFRQVVNAETLKDMLSIVMRDAENRHKSLHHLSREMFQYLDGLQDSKK